MPLAPYGALIDVLVFSYKCVLFRRVEQTQGTTPILGNYKEGNPCQNKYVLKYC